MGADQNIDIRAWAASSLNWWHDAGIDMIVDEAPRSWLDRGDAAVASPVVNDRPPNSTQRARAEPAPPAPLMMPDTIEAFEAWRISDAAPDFAWAPVAVPAQGSAAADIAVIVEMPDRDDEAAGQLLSGMLGKLYERMLAAIGRDRASTYLCSLAATRTPSGRIAASDEAVLADIMRQRLELIGCKRLLVIGNAASRALIGSDVATSRGNLHAVNLNRGTIEAVTSFHPRFLIERPAAKAEAWRDLQLLIRGIEA